MSRLAGGFAMLGALAACGGTTAAPNVMTGPGRAAASSPDAAVSSPTLDAAVTDSSARPLGSGGGAGQCYLYDGRPADGQVELCTFNGMDHCWAGGATAGAGGNSCPTYASATQLEWSFFKRYAW